jgi:uncharacterized protein YndB with AHSA1/START domain
MGVTVTESPVGLTKDAGWQIGVQRTVRAPIEEVWNYLTSPAGQDVWLGTGARLGDTKGEPYTARDGTRGELRSRRQHDRIRFTWHPRGWDHDSTVQVAVRATPKGTTIRFHQERLASAQERALMRKHWERVAEAVKAALEQ